MPTPLRIMVLCTGNSARSLIAEALFRHLGGDRIEAYSAGSRPAGAPHPLALQVLARHGVATAGLRSKSWDEFAQAGAPKLDVVITVCDNAASETCPIWPGAPVRAHWGVPDPAAVQDPHAATAAFEETYDTFRRRIERLLAQPVEGMPAPELAGLLRRFAPTALD